MSTRVTTPTILNVTLTTSGTEYAVPLPKGTTRFKLQARAAVDLKLAYTPAESGSRYFTVKTAAGLPYVEDHLGTEPTLYLQCGTNSTVVEIICWA